MSSLIKPPVNSNALESTVLDLWAEFLGRYFDGSAHDVGAVADLVFPAAELQFQQSAVTQPLDQTASGLAITLVWSDAAPRRWKAWEIVNGARQEMVYQRAAWNFWIRATGANARKTGKNCSDRLYGLLTNTAETRALAQKGIQRLRPFPPRAIQDTDYTLRLVVVDGTLRYPVLSQTTP